MVVVRIELWPGGDREKARPLGLAFISNDETGNTAAGNYDVHLAHSGHYWGRRGIWKQGQVKGWNRQLSPYHLVVEALKAALGLR